MLRMEEHTSYMLLRTRAGQNAVSLLLSLVIVVYNEALTLFPSVSLG